MLALDLVRQQSDASQSEAEAVAEAIIRHQDLGETGKITLLGQLIQLATIYDNMGGNAALIHPDTKVSVVKAYPRLGWSGCFASTIREENRLKPCRSLRNKIPFQVSWNIPILSHFVFYGTKKC